MKKFREGNSYLIKEKYAGSLCAMTIETVTKKGYQVRWHASGNVTWEMKYDFNEKYRLIENITTKVKDEFIAKKLAPPPPPIPNEPKTMTTFKTCPICHGMGNVPDPKSTAGTALCSLCQGGKMIPDKVETIQ